MMMRPIQAVDGRQVFFDDVEVPVGNLFSEENVGWGCAKFLIGSERTGLARVGFIKERIGRIKEPRAGGWPVNEDFSFREKLAACEIELKALELTQLRVLAEGQV